MRWLFVLVVLAAALYAQQVVRVVYPLQLPPADIFSLYVDFKKAVPICPPYCNNTEIVSVTLNGVLDVRSGGGYSVVLYYDRGGGWRALCTLPVVHNAFSGSCAVPSDAKSLGIALWQGGRWLQSVDIHNLRFWTACLCVPRPPTIEGVDHPSVAKVGEDVRFHVWLNWCGNRQEEVRLQIGGVEVVKKASINYTCPLRVRVDFGPFRFEKPGVYNWTVRTQADVRSGSIKIEDVKVCPPILWPPRIINYSVPSVVYVGEPFDVKAVVEGNVPALVVFRLGNTTTSRYVELGKDGCVEKREIVFKPPPLSRPGTESWTIEVWMNRTKTDEKRGVLEVRSRCSPRVSVEGPQRVYLGSSFNMTPATVELAAAS
ncbi:hypothetical protein Pisl_0061 [Pyrobaculum islandicum DSM 4184]|uniref:Uncharacterized protein n=1 Tax=Pyrobaculum islandicum (strain DSM 4184 / JCM 9189 / GEO3) TaxID=384616 RepID=A1RQL3_PYRIL|nr:hypothetical protein [Pyrobaculum islandicum]ABL87245.1 hypothetical protein Pisl_0061 [Pyrobaculum islandicum DSM 4184]